MKRVFWVLLLIMGGVGWMHHATAQVRPTHVVIIFDNTGSFHRWLHVAHAVTNRLFKELYYSMTGLPDDRVTFIALNASPTIVTELQGVELAEKANRAFLEAFRQPDPREGTKVVEALFLAVTAFERMPKSNKFLLIFSDMKPDPAPQNVNGWLKELGKFDWQRLEGVSVWVFLWESEPAASFEMRLKETFPILRKAHFFSPPPTVSSNGGIILEKDALRTYVNKVLLEFQKELAEVIKTNKKEQSTQKGGWGWILFLLVPIAVMALVLVIARALQTRYGGD